MKSKKYSTKNVLGFALSAMMLSSISAFSATAEESYYTSQQQADIGYMNALHQSELTSAQLHEQMNAVNEAESHLRGMRSSGNSGQMQSAENALHNAEGMLSATLSQMTGISQADIEAMHGSGLSWGQLSEEIGVKTQGRLAHSSYQSSNMKSDENTAGTRQKSGQSGSMTARASGAALSDKGMYVDSSGNMTDPALENHNSTSAVSSSQMGSYGGSDMNSMQGDASGSIAMNDMDSTDMAPGTGSTQDMSFQNSDRLSPLAGGVNTRSTVSGNRNQRMTSNDTASPQYGNMGNMQGHGGVSDAEMDAATARNTMNGGVSGHGTDVNSGVDHGSGSMMGGTGGLDSGMGSDHGGGGGDGSGGGMGGSAGGMGSSDSGMGGSGSGGTGGSGSDGGMGGSSGGGMGGGSGGGSGSGGGGMM